jgi:3-dehydroquinate synthetase
VAAARLSAQLTGLPASDVERIALIFKNAGLPTELRLSRAQQSRLLSAMQLDKKVAAGEAKFVLARNIGKAEFGHAVPASVLDRVLSS